MTNLSHWDFATRFSALEAAALILGTDPHETAGDEGRISVVRRRMEFDYERARKRFLTDIEIPFDDKPNLNPEPTELISEEMQYVLRFKFAEDGTPILEWLKEWGRSSFAHQKFSRQSISNWLVSINMHSAYSFNPSVSSASLPFHPRWPWGEHHTELLSHLEAAALRFWVNYDPADLSTAETNATVASWLQNERKVSKTMAEAIASILRPDGLPTGPRK